nr:helix-turn-helix domain-containing protein [Pseudonocardia acaciae]
MSRPGGPCESDGQLLRRLRREAGFSLQQLATVMHYSKGYLSRIENDRKVISVSLARACDAALGTQGELAGRASLALAGGRRGDVPVAQLPSAPAHLVGRDAQRARLTELLAAPGQRSGAVPVVCVDGPPGVGKTALALRCAHDLAGRYPGGVLFAGLRGYAATTGPADPAEVLDQFLRSLGVAPNNIPATVEERAAMFRSLVHGRAVLVVLDNAADSRQVLPLLPGSADCAVLVTSRRRLKGLLVAAAPATCVTLRPLLPDDAHELLRRVIGDEPVHTEPGAAESLESLARRCGYLPLALCIAAVRIATNPHHTIADLASDLSGENEPLDVLSAGDSLTVRGVFSHSYLALRPEVARQFRLLGLYPGAAFGVGAAAALAGVGWSTARRLLDGLTDAHLVEQVGRDRYQLHDLLRAYAAEQARLGSPEERAAAIHRLVDWYLASAGAAVRALTPRRPHWDPPALDPGVEPARFGPDEYERALRWCDLELPAMVPLTRLAADQGLHARAWQLPVVWFDYFLLRRPWDEWIAMHEIGVAAARRIGDDFGHGWALTNLGAAHFRRGDLDLAEEQFRQALEICPGRTGRGWATAGLAFTLISRGDYRGAVGHLERTIGLFYEVGMAYGVATALANLGDAYRELGDLDQAWTYGNEAHQLYASIEDRQAQGYALVRLARTAHRRGDNATALHLCERALLANRTAEDRWTEADALELRGEILYEVGDDSAGERSLNEALSLFQELDAHRAPAPRARA